MAGNDDVTRPDRRLVLAGLALAASPIGAGAKDAPAIGGFKRRPGAVPIIAADPTATFFCPMRQTPVKWRALHAFNPAAVVHDGAVYILFRAEDDSGAMAIGGILRGSGSRAAATGSISPSCRRRSSIPTTTASARPNGMAGARTAAGDARGRAVRVHLQPVQPQGGDAGSRDVARPGVLGKAWRRVRGVALRQDDDEIGGDRATAGGRPPGRGENRRPLLDAVRPGQHLRGAFARHDPLDPGRKRAWQAEGRDGAASRHVRQRAG